MVADMAGHNKSEWRRFAVALGVTLFTLTLLTVLFFATLDRRDVGSYSSTTTTSKRVTYTQGERRFITELDMEGLLDPNYSVDENLEMGYNMCDMIDRMNSSSPAKAVADYLFEQQSIEQLDYRSSYEDIFTVVALANYHLCPS